VNVESPFFQDFDACVAVHNTSIGLDLEGFEASRLQGVHNILCGLLTPILQSHSVWASFQGLVRMDTAKGRGHSRMLPWNIPFL